MSCPTALTLNGPAMLTNRGGMHAVVAALQMNCSSTTDFDFLPLFYVVCLNFFDYYELNEPNEEAMTTCLMMLRLFCASIASDFCLDNAPRSEIFRFLQ